MSRAAPSDDIIASTLLFRLVEVLAEHEQRGLPLPVDLFGDLCAGLRDIAQHVMGLEAVARAVDVLGEREYMRVVRSLPAEGNVLPFPGRGGER